MSFNNIPFLSYSIMKLFESHDAAGDIYDLQFPQQRHRKVGHTLCRSCYHRQPEENTYCIVKKD